MSGTAFQKYRVIFDASPDLLIQIDKKGLIIDVNARITDIAGYGKEELIGKTINALDNILTLKSMELIRNNFAKRMQGLDIKPYEIAGRKKNGSDIFLEMNAVVSRDETGAVNGEFVFLHDITERKNTENALKESEDRYRSIIETSPDGIGIHQNGKIVFVNDKIVKILGAKSPEELIGLRVMDLVHTDSIPAVAERIREMAATGKPMDMIEEKFVKLDGTLIDVETGARPLNYQGQPAILVVVHDITERKKSQFLLNLQSQIVNNVSEGVSLVRVSDGSIVYTNKRFNDMFGYGPEELKGKKAAILSVQERSTHEEITDKISETLAKNRVWRGELENIKKDGSHFWCSASISSFTDPEYGAAWITILQDISERRKNELELQESQAKLKTMISAMDDLVFMFDTDGKFLYCHSPNESILYMPPEVFIGRKYSEIMPEHIAKGLAEALETNRNGKAYDFEYPLEVRGTHFWFFARISPIYTRGIYRGSVAVVRDITESKKHHVELLSEKNKLRQYMDISSIVFVVIGKDQTITMINKFACDISGYKENEVLGKNWFDIFIPEKNRNEIKEVFNRIMAGGDGSSEKFENDIICKDGSRRTILWHNTTIKDEAGNITGTLSSGDDITERKEAEIKIARSETRYRRLFETTRDGIIIINADSGKVIDANPSIIDVLGYDTDEIIGKKLWEIGFVRDIIKTSNAFEELLRNKYSRYENTPVTKKDGSIVDVEFISNLYEVENERVIQCNIRDISERTRLLNQVKEALKTKEQFTATVSHELRTPLASIKEGISAVLDGVAGEIKKEQRALLSISKRNVDRLSRLIGNVLDLQKMDSGQMDFKFGEIDISEVVGETFDTMLPVARQKNIDLSKELGANLPKIRADRDKILQVLANLTNNAIQSTEKGSISIKAFSEDGRIRIEVQDTGSGIKEEDLPKLFLRFSQIKRRFGGTGLGLAICKEIIEAHHGRIWAESQPDKGSRFQFTLPTK